MWADENIAKSDNFNEEDFDWEWNGSMWIESCNQEIPLNTHPIPTC